MELTVLGSSGTYPAPGRPASGYLVRSAGTTIWCDAGPGTFSEMAALVEPASLDAVILSHLHPDHCTDLFALAHYLAFGPPMGSVCIDVLAPPASADRFFGFLDAGVGHAVRDVLRFVEAVPGLAPTFGALGVTFAAATHSIPALVTRFASGGGDLVYSGDTGPFPNFEVFASGAGLLLCEASLGVDDPPYVHHMTARQAGRVAAAAGVGRLVLTHLRPTLDADRAIAGAASVYDGEVLVAEPGMRIDI
ncbi:MAG: MBL fold metallo-hydrolase [Acidimicrobiia bacterium]